MRCKVLGVFHPIHPQCECANIKWSKFMLKRINGEKVPQNENSPCLLKVRQRHGRA